MCCYLRKMTIYSKKFKLSMFATVAAIGHGAHKPETVIEIKKCN